jgi:hypothetical protein
MPAINELLLKELSVGQPYTTNWIALEWRCHEWQRLGTRGISLRIWKWNRDNAIAFVFVGVETNKNH